MKMFGWTPNLRKFGWIPDLPDQRDHLYKLAPTPTPPPLRSQVDLRPQMPPIYDQGSVGSCTANAVGGDSEFLHSRLDHRLNPSRLFLYYHAREQIGTTGWDSGATIRDTIKVLAALGACQETLWPYIPFHLTDEPTPEAHAAAIKHRALSYQRLTWDRPTLQRVLMAGYPFVFGFTVYASFASIGRDGIMPVPKPTERILGGHAVLAVGYDARRSRWIVRNSWGAGWGAEGYFYMPFECLVPSMSDDLWVLTTEQ